MPCIQTQWANNITVKTVNSTQYIHVLLYTVFYFYIHGYYTIYSYSTYSCNVTWDTILVQCHMMSLQILLYTSCTSCYAIINTHTGIVVFTNVGLGTSFNYYQVQLPVVWCSNLSQFKPLYIYIYSNHGWGKLVLQVLSILYSYIYKIHPGKCLHCKKDTQVYSVRIFQCYEFHEFCESCLNSSLLKCCPSHPMSAKRLSKPCPKHK